MQPHRRIARTAVLAFVLATLTTGSFVPTTGAGAGGFGPVAADRVKGGLRRPAGFTFLPNGNIVFLERSTGQVRFLNPATGHDWRVFTITGVNGSGERGALGVAAHPAWPNRTTLFVYVTRKDGGSLRNQIVRIRMTRREGVLRGTGMKVLVSTPASSSPYHNGGRIAFGPDGTLYAVVGDGHRAANAQDLTGNLRGKILRMRPDGGIPADNPVIRGRRSRIFAYGIRNSFGFTFDPLTDRLWETENGPECNDEINLITRGRNYGWGPKENCPDTNRDGPDPVRPIRRFANTIGITGAAFCDDCGLQFRDQLFFGSCCDGGVLRRAKLDPDRDGFLRVRRVMLVPGGEIYSMETAPDGRIYFSDRSSIWRLSQNVV